MIFPASMKNVSIIVHKEYQEKLICALHEIGIIDILHIKESLNNLNEMLNIGESHSEIGKCTEYKMRIDRILNILKEVHEEKEGLLKKLFNPTPIDKSLVAEEDCTILLNETEIILQKVEPLIEIREELSHIEDLINESKVQKEHIELLKTFEFNLTHIGKTEYLYIIAGIVRNEEFEEFNIALTHEDLKELILLKEPIQNNYIVIIATIIENVKKLETITKSNLFDEVHIRPIDATPIDAINIIDKEIDELYLKREELIHKLKSFDNEWYRNLTILQERLSIEWDRMNVASKFGITKHAFIIEGWIDSKDKSTLIDLCEDVTEGHAFLEFNDSSSYDVPKVPFKYENPSFLKPFEFLTTMYSRPKYDEIDPTFITAPLIVIFFGLMLGDAIYGLFIAILGFLLYQGIGKIEKSAKDMSIVLMSIGVSAIVFGIPQGGYFGNAPYVFLGIQVPYLLDPLRDPISLLIIALIIGFIHLNIGLIISAYQNIRRKEYKEVMFGPVAWFIIQPFAFILMFDFFKWAIIDPILINISIGGFIFGSMLLFIKKGPLAVFDLTGYLGNWLSYARILALALATGGIAMTINLLTQMVSDIHPFMIIIGIIVFIIGHLFNFTLQSLGAFIHSLRLQYVEFFGQFYVGGELEFNPFRVIRQYTKNKNNKN